MALRRTTSSLPDVSRCHRRCRLTCAAAVISAAIFAIYTCNVIWGGGIHTPNANLFVYFYYGQIHIGGRRPWMSGGEWGGTRVYRYRVKSTVRLTSRRARNDELRWWFDLDRATFASGQTQWRLEIPLWAPLASSLLATLLFWRSSRSRNFACCGGCGYPVGRSSVCTECGAPLSKYPAPPNQSLQQTGRPSRDRLHQQDVQ